MNDTLPIDHATFEAIAEAVHDGWVATKKSQGIHSRLSETGEEQIAPYSVLSEEAKDLDRGTVRSVLQALPAAGLKVVAA